MGSRLTQRSEPSLAAKDSRTILKLIIEAAQRGLFSFQLDKLDSHQSTVLRLERRDGTINRATQCDYVKGVQSTDSSRLTEREEPTRVGTLNARLL